MEIADKYLRSLLDQIGKRSSKICLLANEPIEDIDKIPALIEQIRVQNSVIQDVLVSFHDCFLQRKQSDYKRKFHSIIDMIQHYWFQKGILTDEMVNECLSYLHKDKNPFLYLKDKMEKRLEEMAIEYTLQSDVFTLYLDNDKEPLRPFPLTIFVAEPNQIRCPFCFALVTEKEKLSAYHQSKQCKGQV